MSGFESVMGTTVPVFLGITLVFMGGCSFMTGQALAATWRPQWHAVPYALLLGLGDRFLTFALFQGDLISVGGYIIDTAIIFGVAMTAYRITRARQMATQYPWIYERAGLFGWRERG